jgi:hypothetical protein
MDLSGHDPARGRVVLTCGLPDLRLEVDVPEMQCGYQLVSGALIAEGEVRQRGDVFNAERAGHGRRLGLNTCKKQDLIII